jgi:hypothetical protein
VTDAQQQTVSLTNTAYNTGVTDGKFIITTGTVDFALDGSTNTPINYSDTLIKSKQAYTNGQSNPTTSPFVASGQFDYQNYNLTSQYYGNTATPTPTTLALAATLYQTGTQQAFAEGWRQANLLNAGVGAILGTGGNSGYNPQGGFTLTPSALTWTTNSPTTRISSSPQQTDPCPVPKSVLGSTNTRWITPTTTVGAGGPWTITFRATSSKIYFAVLTQLKPSVAGTYSGISQVVYRSDNTIINTIGIKSVLNPFTTGTSGSVYQQGSPSGLYLYPNVLNTTGSCAAIGFYSINATPGSNITIKATIVSDTLNYTFNSPQLEYYQAIYTLPNYNYLSGWDDSYSI